VSNEVKSQKCWDKLTTGKLELYAMDIQCSVFDPALTNANLAKLETILNKGENLQVNLGYRTKVNVLFGPK
jgi:hypothetical protein